MFILNCIIDEIKGIVCVISPFVIIGIPVYAFCVYYPDMFMSIQF
jgi:hypothetical protein